MLSTCEKGEYSWIGKRLTLGSGQPIREESHIEEMHFQGKVYIIGMNLL